VSLGELHVWDDEPRAVTPEELRHRARADRKPLDELVERLA
jgi:hypothetical protein